MRRLLDMFAIATLTYMFVYLTYSVMEDETGRMLVKVIGILILFLWSAMRVLKIIDRNL